MADNIDILLLLVEELSKPFDEQCNGGLPRQGRKVSDVSDLSKFLNIY